MAHSIHLDHRSAQLARFVADGLLATVESYHRGALPLHRFVWELRVRVDALADVPTAGATADPADRQPAAVPATVCLPTSNNCR